MSEQKIIQGDCLEVMKTFPDKSFDLVLTDPPYGINYDVQQNEQADSGRISNGGRWKKYDNAGWDSKPPSKDYFDEMLRVSKRQVIWGGNYFNLPTHTTWLIWNKVQRGFMTDGEMAWTSIDKSIKIFDLARTDAYINSKEGKFHPTQKPVKLISWCLEMFSSAHDTILDPFMGSGTTLVAAKLLNRNATGIEISPGYCEIARQRLRQDVLF